MKKQFLWCGVWALVIVGSVSAKARVLLYHGFDGPLVKADHAAGRVSIRHGDDVETRTPAIRGKAAWFSDRAKDSTLRIDLGDLVNRERWTVALWQIIEVKAWLTSPDDNLLTLLDSENKPIVRLTKSGRVFVFEKDRVIHFDCFDALYWVRGSREHLALTWDSTGSGVKSPKGMLRAFWKARPYASFVIDGLRRPTAIEIGQPAAGLGVDDLFVLDEALSLRSLWELMQDRGTDIVALEKKLTERERIEKARPQARRDASWASAVAHGVVVEAEANPGKAEVVTSPTPDSKRKGHFEGSKSNASTASGGACVAPGSEPLSFFVEVDRTGEYVLSVRYCLARKMFPLWPQNSKAKTPWTENYSTVDVSLDDKKMSSIRLYPTGEYSGHAGDVEMWAWRELLAGKRVRLEKGKHRLTLRCRSGLEKPIFDALLVSATAGESPPHPRWVDRYRIPPAWWVAGHRTSLSGPKRIDEYTVTLRNRCDEPCRYEIVVGSESLRKQKARTNVNRIALGPFEEKTFRVLFESDGRIGNDSEWANIYLWNEDVALRQKYRVWNLIPPRMASSHPVLVEAPDEKLRTELKRWLEKRDPKSLTPELKKWTRSRNLAIGQAGQVRAFSGAFAGERLTALDAWMKMSERELDQYLPDGPTEYNGYGEGWERTGVEYAGVWHKMPKVTGLAPKGDIDFVTSVTVGGPPQKGKSEPYSKTYSAPRDLDMIGSVRDTRWKSMLGFGLSGSAPYGETPLGRHAHTGIPLLAEAYYLTGNKSYARQAVKMLRVFARKYTGLTKHFYYTIHREDRDWWGGRIGGRYLMKFGPRYYQTMGIYVLDLLWDALTPDERTMIEHNVVRWGMYEGMSGPLFEVPEFFAAVNREDLPYLILGRVLGDPAPQRGAAFFYDLYKDIVLADGIHQCSIGSYGGVGTYVSFLQKMDALGVDVSKNEALRNAYSAHPRFIFSGGGVPNIDDGGGVNLQGLGAGFGCPNRAQYEWGRKFFGEPTFRVWPDLIESAQRVNNGPAKDKAARMRNEYLEGAKHIAELWPDVYVAPIKGLAMLRNRTAKEPIDWVEVIVDYGLMGGRAHGQAAKLATIPSFNGQIVSMEYGYGLHGKPVSTGFHMRSYAHNVVVVDGRNQFSASGAVPVGRLRGTHMGKGVQWIDTESSRIYDGIDMRRVVFTTPFGIVDLYRCRSNEEHEYDWMFHSFGVADPGPQAKAVARLSESGPLTFAVNPRTYSTDGTVQVTWKNTPLTKPAKKSSTAILHEDAFVRVWSTKSKGTTVGVFGIPMVESVGGEIDYLMLRRRDRSTVFATVQEPWRESTGSKVKTIERLPVRVGDKIVSEMGAYALAVTLKNGERRVYFVNASSGVKSIESVRTDADVATWMIDKDGRVRDVEHTEGKQFREDVR